MGHVSRSRHYGGPARAVVAPVPRLETKYINIVYTCLIQEQVGQVTTDERAQATTGQSGEGEIRDEHGGGPGPGARPKLREKGQRGDSRHTLVPPPPIRIPHSQRWLIIPHLPSETRRSGHWPLRCRKRFLGEVGGRVCPTTTREARPSVCILGRHGRGRSCTREVDWWDRTRAERLTITITITRSIHSPRTYSLLSAGPGDLFSTMTDAQPASDLRRPPLRQQRSSVSEQGGVRAVRSQASGRLECRLCLAGSTRAAIAPRAPLSPAHPARRARPCMDARSPVRHAAGSPRAGYLSALASV